uniref:Uncharacterized protein n=1 Tax=Rhizophora mucronata TaxID=61149 RepID=A0A2P2JJ21_RHIMU
MEERRGDGGGGGVVDIDKSMVIMEPEQSTRGGLHVPVKERLEFRAPEKKSLLGLDVLANTKRGGSDANVGFKIPRERVTSVVASLDEEEDLASSEISGAGDSTTDGASVHVRRCYREASTAETSSAFAESVMTREGSISDAPRTHHLRENMSSYESTSSVGSTQSVWSRSPKSERDNHNSARKNFKKETRRENRQVRPKHSNGREERYHGREAHERDCGRKRNRYEGSGRTPGRSDWDDGRWEWEETPRQDGHSNAKQCHRPSPSPMFIGASPDARLVSPWLDGHTPRSVANTASPWDHISPSPVPIRASGSSVKSSSSRHYGRSHKPAFSTIRSQMSENQEADKSYTSEEHNHEITEDMRLEMEYDADRAWYDREEGNTMFDADSSSFFLEEEASFEKKKTELTKKLVRRDGTRMSLAQSKRLSQLTADNAQWEDRQLLRSGAVRGTEVQTDFDDEEERKVILLVHDTKPPFLDGRVVFTKQAEPVMPIKDPTSDMAIISRKGSALVREVHEKQSMHKSRQRFWELAGSKLGDILGVEKTAEQIDADTAKVGEEGEVDFKEEAKFAQHMKKGEAVSDFAMSKTIAEQRQYLPIFSVRDELLQV